VSRAGPRDEILSRGLDTKTRKRFSSYGEFG
jgi:hypothetical protein